MSAGSSKPGPRRDHSRSAFETLVIDHAEAIVRADGAGGLGMRRLAASVGYAPNSIYHAIGDFDGVLERLNARTLARLNARLDTLAAEPRAPRARVVRLADGFLDFVLADPHLCGLAAGERTASMGSASSGRAHVAALIDDALAPLIGDAGDRRRIAAALWAALHGLATLAITGSLVAAASDDPRRLARRLVGAVLDGLDRG